MIGGAPPPGEQHAVSSRWTMSACPGVLRRKRASTNATFSSKIKSLIILFI
jgi:hypothetical protein